MKITFHMAFDLIGEKENYENSFNFDFTLNKKFEAIEDLINLGVERILTKGGFDSKNAIEGKDYLKKYHKNDITNKFNLLKDYKNNKNNLTINDIIENFIDQLWLL